MSPTWGWAVGGPQPPLGGLAPLKVGLEEVGIPFWRTSPTLEKWPAPLFDQTPGLLETANRVRSSVSFTLYIGESAAPF